MIAVVSGGGSGIGQAIAGQLCADGHTVVILGRRREALELACRSIEGDVRPIVVDLADPGQVERAAAEIGGWGRVRVLVNNAGAMSVPPEGGSLTEVADAWRRGLDANLMTAVLLTTALLDRMERPGGRIVFIGSTAGQRGGSGFSGGAYAAAKAALHGWALSLARQVGPDGITVNVLAPGYIEGTEFFGDRGTPDFLRQKLADTLVGRVGTPDDVAAAVSYLVSSRAGYLTGQIIGLNGGAVPGR